MIDDKYTFDDSLENESLNNNMTEGTNPSVVGSEENVETPPVGPSDIDSSLDDIVFSVQCPVKLLDSSNLLTNHIFILQFKSDSSNQSDSSVPIRLGPSGWFVHL